MNQTRFAVRALLAAACVAFSLHAAAQPMAGHDHHGPFGHPGTARGGHPPGLKGVRLSDEQKDRIFAIMHAQAPAVHEQGRKLRAAQEALHALGMTAQFDDKKAAQLAQEAGQAVAALSLQRARTESQVNAVLTPEQRKLAESQRSQHPSQPPAKD